MAELLINGQATVKADRQLVEDGRPIENRHAPGALNILGNKVQQLAGGFGIRESRFGFSDLTKLAMIAFDHVGGIDQATDFFGEIEV